MMADDTNVNAKEKIRQSIDTLLDFSLENTSVPVTEASTSDDNVVFHPPRFDCENINKKQRQKRFCAGWDEGTSDDMSHGRNNSIKSIHSTDSGYASKKCTVIIEATASESSITPHHLISDRKHKNRVGWDERTSSDMCEDSNDRETNQTTELSTKEQECKSKQPHTRCEDSGVITRSKSHK